jgi:hypothetical protein
MGQAASNILYTARASGYSVLLTSNKALLKLSRHLHARKDESGEIRQSTVSISLAGASAKPQARPSSKLKSTSNYFIGDNAARWLTGIPNYASVAFQGVYPGIDMVYHGDDHRLEYDFVAAPGSDPNHIALSIDGADRVRIDSGDLVIETPAGSIRQLRPLAYQETSGARQEVACSYHLAGAHAVTFDLGPYDRSRELVIDPVIDYTTYLGGTGNDNGNAVAVDSAGNMYVAGDTTSTDFPVSAGARQGTKAGPTDAYVTKLDPTGAMVFSTYFGGLFQNTSAFGVAVDASGNVYCTGQTNGGIPVTAGSFQTTYAGGVDGFIFKLDPTGSTLVYSTYVGGFDMDVPAAIVVDSTGQALIAGRTTSTNFPLNPFGGGVQATNGGGQDGFLFELSPDGRYVHFGSYLGGAADDSITGLALDGAGNIYVTGRTASANFPTTAGAFQTTKSGPSWGTNAFITKIGASSFPIIYSTYLGGTSGTDIANGIAVDCSGNAYVTGFAESPDFPITPGAFQTTFLGGPQSPSPSDCFVAKVSASGSSLAYSTFIGGTGSDVANAIAIDSSGNAVVTGFTSSTDFPVTPDALQHSYGGGNMDAFLSRINPTGSSLVYSTYYGGSSTDQAYAVAVDSANTAYIAGTTSSYDVPALPGAFQPRFAGGSEDAFLAKLSLDGAGYTISGTVTNDLGNPLHNVTIQITGSASMTTLTDINGFYSIGSLPPGSNLTVTASRAGFSPPGVSVTNLSQDQTINFSGRAGLTISGKVVDNKGAPVNYITLNVNTTPVSTATTDANGNYTFSMLPEGGTFTVTPTSSYATFSPVSATTGPLTGDVILSNFVAALPINISGHIASGGSGAYGVAVTLTGSASQTTQTDSSGNYAFYSLPNGGTYTVTPSSSIYTFSPPGQTLANVVSNQQGVNFTALPKVQISGQVGGNLGGLSSITVTLSGGASATTQTNSYGNYVFGNLAQGVTYTVTPSDPRYTFTPASQTFPNISSYQLQNFSATRNTFQISGLVKDSGGNPITGATVTLAGAQSGPTQTDSSGAYSFTGLSAGFNYTLTPSKPGYSFTPTAFTVANLSSDQSVNFTAALMNFSITGQVSLGGGGAVAGVTVTLSGSSSGSTATDAQGNYSFASVGATGNYTVTPSFAGYTFSPTTQSLTNLLANQTLNFTATRLTFAISGQVTDGTGAALSNVTMTLTGSQITTTVTTTDASGNYSFASIPAAANYTVTPTRNHYVFSPANSAITNLLSNSTASFTGTLQSNTISGNVVDSNGIAIAGVTMTLSGSTSATASSDTNGNYSFGPLSDGGNYTVTASKTFYTFAVPSKTFNDLGADQTANFTGTLQTFSITGQVLQGGSALAGATIALTGTTSGSAVTDSSGNYTFTGLTAGGSYTVTPARQFYLFSPPSQSFANLSSNQTANFTGTLQTFSISGQVSVSGAPLPGVTVALSGTTAGSAVTDSGGNYSFSGLTAGGSYTVTPSKTYYTFSPALQSFASLTSNQAASFAAVPVTFSISGHATQSGSPLPGTAITLTGTMSGSTVTDASGAYMFSGLTAGGSYTVTPSLAYFSFMPAGYSFSALSANQTADFAGARNTYQISGVVADACSKPTPGVTMTLVHGAVTVTATTDSNGAYSFTGVQAGYNYLLTPSFSGYTFNPGSASFNALGSNQAANFTTIPATQTSQVTLTADAYVRGGSNANNNYGNQNQLITQLASSAGNTFETYVMFDVGQHCTVSSVKLRLFGRLNNNNPLNVPVSAYSVANTTWTETGITWNNKPPEGSLLTTTIIANNTQAWYEWDITSYIQSELAAGRHIIAIALKNTTVTSNQAVFNSRQASSNKPVVVVTTP